MSTSSTNVVGIDLGTTFSAIATLDDRGQATTIPNREGEMLTPSVVLLDEGGAIVGQPAREVALELPDRVASLIKRSMGYSQYPRPLMGRDFRPETLSAIILRKLISDAELRIGPISKAVITVPAYFDDTRRKATQDAGRIAGLEVVDIIDEPTAAALAYSFQEPHGGGPSVLSMGISETQTVLVYDLGGGTFDVALVRLAPRRFETLGVDGDVLLGGRDWDERIVEYVARKFIETHGSDPRTDPQAAETLSEAAERAKKTLGKLSQANITCTHAGKVLTVSFTRAEFESITKDLLMRTRLTTQQVLKQAGISWSDVDRILMVGGSTHMPMTSNMLQNLTGKVPDRTLAVSEVVARGAAIHAGIVTARENKGNQSSGLASDLQDVLEQVIEINVISHSLGIEIKLNDERVNDILVPKNRQLPTAASRVYKTVVENQPQVRVKVLQGEAPQADACISIGECWIEGLPPDLPKKSPIQVRCSVGSNGMIDVMALDMTSGKMVQTEIHRSSGLSEDEIAKEAEWVRQLTVQ
ncbi:MAG: Hsp70 family protein [Gemmataceae bacterium]